MTDQVGVSEEPPVAPVVPGFRPTSLTLAHRVLLRVAEGAYATLALSGELQRASLSGRDKGLCTELVYGSLRQQLRLDRALAAYAPKGLGKLDVVTVNALRLGAYQLLFLHTPAHAAVSGVVNLLSRLRGKGLAGFANALLRKLATAGEPPLPELSPQDSPKRQAAVLGVRTALPTFLAEDALLRFGLPEAETFLRSLSDPAPTWLRLNTLRGEVPPALEELHKEVESSSPFAALPEAVLLRSGFPFQGAAYADGWFTAQDLGAQLVARLLLADTAAGPLTLPPGVLLDACAGIGGKATHLAALTDNQRDLEAADRSERKLDLCLDHVHRLRCTRVKTIAADLTSPDAPLLPQYAAVLLDAPCSGMGVLRRHPEARHRTSMADVQALSALQAQLLDQLAARVVVGGVLVYSVCSYLDQEGPLQVAQFLQRHPEFAPLPPGDTQPEWASFLETTSGTSSPDRDPAAPRIPGAIRTWPHRHNADAFYAVRLIRTA